VGSNPASGMDIRLLRVSCVVRLRSLRVALLVQSRTECGVCKAEVHTDILYATRQRVQPPVVSERGIK
jgi:hypothetical protein